MTFIASSGDGGVGYSQEEACLVNGTLEGFAGAPSTFVGQFPASCPYVTAVGATQVVPGNSVSSISNDFGGMLLTPRRRWMILNLPRSPSRPAAASLTTSPLLPSSLISLTRISLHMRLPTPLVLSTSLDAGIQTSRRMGEYARVFQLIPPNNH